MKDHRRQQILDLLEREHYLSTESCCSLLGCSAATIRRDFLALSRAGTVLRTHGGVRRISEDTNSLLPVGARVNINPEEKAQLCRYAASLIHQGMSVMIYGGTTMTVLGDYLKTGFITTNQPGLALRILENFPMGGGPEISLVGGHLDNRSGIVLGSRACEFVRQYECDLGLFSVFSCDEYGLLERDDDSCITLAQMFRQSRRRVVLVDHEKFQRKGICRCIPWEKVDLLVTGRSSMNIPILQKIREKGTQVVIVDQQ